MLIMKYCLLVHYLYSSEKFKPHIYYFRVITGLRFVKMNGIIHIQIQEGTLEHHGRLNQSSIAWQPVDNFKTKDTKEGKDYMRMSYYKRAIDLDDLKAPKEHVITGLSTEYQTFLTKNKYLSIHYCLEKTSQQSQL